MENNAGVWLDSKQAIIFKIKNNQEMEARITTELDSKHVKGGSRMSVPYGPHDAVSDSKVTERRKHQMNEYFEEIMKEIKGANRILLFGPGSIKKQLKLKIEDEYHFRKSTVMLETADSMTDNQIKARIRIFF